MKKKTAYFSEDQIEAIIKQAEDLTQRTALFLGSCLGARVQEFLALEVKDIHFEEELVYVWDVKKKNIRYQPTLKDDLAQVRLYLKEKEIKEGKIFDVVDRTLNRYLKKATKRAKIPIPENENVRWHSFRGSLVRNLTKRKVPLKAIMQITGDSAKTILEYYNEYRPSDLVQLIKESRGGI